MVPTRAMGSRREMSGRRIVLGMPLIGGNQWKGGLNYQRSVLQLIAGPLADRVAVRVIVSPEEEDLAQEAFGAWLTSPLIVDARVRGAGQGSRAIQAMAFGADRHLADLVTEQGINVFFENARFYGWAFPCPILAWIPDFQHRRLPHLFSRRAFWRRDIGFRAQTLGRRTILLSSETARADAERFYPRARGRVHVAPFAGQFDISKIYTGISEALAQHDLPKEFFYLPNQFWTHKNHEVVLEALKILKHDGRIAACPPVVMSGPTEDPRDPGHFQRLMTDAERNELGTQFRHLGLIPYAHVLSLNAGATAVLNPSRFEGWASSVEEAKALATPLLLSDTPIHREQAPGARFFDPSNPADLASCLVEAAHKPRERVDAHTLEEDQSARVGKFASAFGAALQAAMSSNLKLAREG